MNTTRILSLIVCVVILSLIAAQADVINIDGYATDWGSPDNTNDDARDGWYNAQWNDDVDIDFNYYEWDYETGSGYCAFAFETYATMPDNTSLDYAEILINIDKNTGSGGTRHGHPGFEYAIWYDLSPTTPIVTLFEYTDPSGAPPLDWYAVIGADVDALRLDPTDFVEFRVAATDIGYPPSFEWGAYYENDQGPPDDLCPDDADQPGETPEPATMTLFGLGLLGLGVWRRRRTAA